MRGFKSILINSVLLIFIFFALSSCYTPQWLEKYNKDLFTSNTEIIKDIEGDIEKTEYLIGKDSDLVLLLYLNRIETLDTGNVEYFLSCDYWGVEWLFIEEIKMKVGENVYKKTDNDPVRDTFQDPNAGVYESVMVNLEPKLVEEIKKSNSVRVQVSSTIFDFEGQDLKKVKRFLPNP